VKLRDLFTRRERGRDLDEALRELERSAESASPGFSAPIWNRAGDLCMREGRVDRALTYYGKAIDDYLEGGRASAARALCQKVIRVSPNVIRARRTLALLNLAEGREEEARLQLREYVRAAKEAGQMELAIRQLHVMGDVAPNAALRETIAQQLDELGDFEGAKMLREAEDERDDDELPLEPTRRWFRFLVAAKMPPEELRRCATEAGR